MDMFKFLYIVIGIISTFTMHHICHDSGYSSFVFCGFAPACFVLVSFVFVVSTCMPVCLTAFGSSSFDNIMVTLQVLYMSWLSCQGSGGDGGFLTTGQDWPSSLKPLLQY